MPAIPMACRTNGILTLFSGKSFFSLGTRTSDQAEISVMKIAQIPQVASESDGERA